MGGIIAGTAVAPNLPIALEKPLRRLLKHLDKRECQREYQRIVYNLKAQGYLAGDYEHGLQLTDKARARLAQREADIHPIHSQKSWDHQWRIIIYDIPEKSKSARNALAHILRTIGCFQLQKSAWITPFPCRKDIETIAAKYEVDQHITYFETTSLDNAKPLMRRFQKKYPQTRFS